MNRALEINNSSVLTQQVSQFLTGNHHHLIFLSADLINFLTTHQYHVKYQISQWWLQRLLSSILKFEARGSSKVLVLIYHTTWHHILEDRTIYTNIITFNITTFKVTDISVLHF